MKVDLTLMALLFSEDETHLKTRHYHDWKWPGVEHRGGRGRAAQLPAAKAARSPGISARCLAPRNNFQFWCKRVSVMTAFSAVVWLPRNTSTHKLTESRVLHNMVTGSMRCCKAATHSDARTDIDAHISYFVSYDQTTACGRELWNIDFNMGSSQMESRHCSFPT